MGNYKDTCTSASQWPARPDQELRIVVDDSALMETLSSLIDSADLSFVIADDVLRFLGLGDEIGSIDLDDSAASCAGYLRVLLKPSESLLSFVAALGARYG